MDTTNYASLTFWLNPGRGGQVVTLHALLSGMLVPMSFTLPAMTQNHPIAVIRMCLLSRTLGRP